MKNLLAILAVLTALASCSSPKLKQSVSDNMTPIETVEYFFEQLGNKNSEGIYYVTNKKENDYYDLNSLQSVKVLSCKEIDYPKEERGEDYDPLTHSMVEVTFIMENTGVFSATNGQEITWTVYLSKETKESRWKMIDWGHA